MTVTRPTFYLVPVTQELSDAVITGQWPEVETKVLKCITLVSHSQLSEGMETPEYRRVAFQLPAYDRIQGPSQKPVGEVPSTEIALLTTSIRMSLQILWLRTQISLHPLSHKQMKSIKGSAGGFF